MLASAFRSSDLSGAAVFPASDPSALRKLDAGASSFLFGVIAHEQTGAQWRCREL